jgi:hypothetical protein
LATLTGDKLKKLKFIQDLPYVELIEAHKIIDKGADVALLYFWFNLLKCNYKILPEMAVQKEVVHYTNLYPTWEGEIINWFNDYLDRVKAYDPNYSVKRTA